MLHFFLFFFGRGHWAGDHLSIWMFITDHSLHVIYDLFSCLSVIVSWGMNTGSFLYVKLSAISSPREINFVWICLKLKWNVKLFIVSTKTGTQQEFSIKLTIWTFSSKKQLIFINLFLSSSLNCFYNNIKRNHLFSLLRKRQEGIKPVICIFQLCTGRGNSKPRWQLESSDTSEEELEPNPVVQQVKLIMVRLSDVSFSLPYSDMAEAFYESQYLSDFQLSVVKLKPMEFI